MMMPTKKLKDSINFTFYNIYTFFVLYKGEIGIKILCWEVEILCWIVDKSVRKINCITEKYGFEKLEIYRVDRDGDKNGI